jgi:hypothetical protein
VRRAWTPLSPCATNNRRPQLSSKATPTGISFRARPFRAAHSQGDTYEEAVENIKDAVRLYIEDRAYRVLRECFAQAADDALLAENDHGIEKRGGDGLAYDCDAAGVDEQAGFHAGGFSDRARGPIARIVTPVGQRFERVG